MFSENLRQINLYLREITNDATMQNLNRLKKRIKNDDNISCELTIRDIISQLQILYEYLFIIECGKMKNEKYINDLKFDYTIHLSKCIEDRISKEIFVYGSKDEFKCIIKIYDIISLIRKFLTDYQMYNKKYFIELWNNNYLTKFKNLGVEKVYEIK